MTLRKEVIMMVMAGSICLPGFQTDLNAACSRSDVEYYLEKGFPMSRLRQSAVNQRAMPRVKPPGRRR